jgi:hypothetical protein
MVILPPRAKAGKAALRRIPFGRHERDSLRSGHAKWATTAGQSRSTQPLYSLVVAGYQKNDPNYLTGYCGNHMRNDAEIETHLRTDHRQDEKNAD